MEYETEYRLGRVGRREGESCGADSAARVAADSGRVYTHKDSLPTV